jgi:glycosyltransferase involved in cell wall biosynthesis
MRADSSERRPVVVVVIKGLGIGGAEKLISEAARFWDRSGFDYRVAYMLPWKNQLVGELEARAVPVRCIGSERGVTPTVLLRLRRLLDEWQANLVHAHLPVAGIISRIASRVPIVYTEHNLAWSYRPLTRMLNRLTYRHNDAVTAVSSAVAETIADYPGPPALVVPNGVWVANDSEAESLARAELGLSSDDALVVHVGNIRPGKGHDVLIDAAALLRERGIKVTVVSIGVEKRPGDLRRLQAKVVETGLDGGFRFLGRRLDALRFISAADVYVNPAEFEGLPITILEAMALGRPVVATDAGGVGSLVKDEETGLLVAPGDAAGLATAIERLLVDRSLAAGLAKAGADLVGQRYGLEPMVRTFESVYRRVLA